MEIMALHGKKLSVLFACVEANLSLLLPKKIPDDMKIIQLDNIINGIILVYIISLLDECDNSRLDPA